MVQRMTTVFMDWAGTSNCSAAALTSTVTDTACLVLFTVAALEYQTAFLLRLQLITGHRFSGTREIRSQQRRKAQIGKSF
jgi:hypothetical protein